MRRKALLVLGFVLVAVVMACGGTPEPAVDVEATVQARLKEERAAEATVEAKAQAMAKAIVVITSSLYEEWGIALRELGKRGVRMAAVLLDGNSFGGFLDSLDALDELYLAGLPTYVVKKGDNIPAALKNHYTGAGLATPEQLEIGAGS
jgi:type II secretory pathway component PulM